ncbi:c-type cytochrome [Frateuria aurantia]|uniref:c-type cytochrome n=1 Tax=Frateuria aurantia TaxID=81475 RepID=UPI0002D58BB8|nr:c-type cytochrome [Frateuria aurantia]
MNQLPESKSLPLDQPSQMRPIQHRIATFVAIALSTCSMAAASSAFAQEKTPISAPPAQAIKQDPIERGKYLAIAADCAACHTVPGSTQLFAGGYAIDSPMGKIYSSNITPSKQYGIGNYTEAQFAAAVRDGVNAKGEHLYPAMPYPSYAALTDDDISALYAYFMNGVKPVEAPAPETRLPFPFNIRASMLGWNLLNLSSKRFTPDPSKPADWNRGKYLVDDLAHCSECHTPRNALMALQGGSALYSGSQLGSWHAPNITSDKVSGIGGWSDQELATYLKTGHLDGKAQAAGPMAEAITNSLQHLTDGDIHDIIVYLRSLPAVATPGQTSPSYAQGQPSDAEADTMGTPILVDNVAHMSGEELYLNTCASCHQADGKGTADGFYPSLVHNTAVGGSSPDNLIATILFGVERDAGGKHTLMPGFGPGSEVQELSDTEVATLANYVLKQYGNASLTVTAADVATVRQGGPTPLIAKVAAPGAWAGIVVAIIVVLLLIGLIARRKRSH